MSHFGSANWPDQFGRVAGLESATPALMLEATADTSTEGTDKLTFTVRSTGMYLVSANIKVTEASDAATSHALSARVAYNDGSAIAVVSLGLTGVTPGTVDGKVLNTNAAQMRVIKAVAGTTITVTVLNTVTGAKTAGVGEYALNFTIVRL